MSEHLISVRDMVGDINNFLFDLGPGPVVEESEPQAAGGAAGR